MNKFEIPRSYKVAFGVWLAIVISLLVTAVYVAHHFITKYW